MFLYDISYKNVYQNIANKLFSNSEMHEQPLVEPHVP